MQRFLNFHSFRNIYFFLKFSNISDVLLFSLSHHFALNVLMGQNKTSENITLDSGKLQFALCNEQFWWKHFVGQYRSPVPGAHHHTPENNL